MSDWRNSSKVISTCPRLLRWLLRVRMKYHRLRFANGSLPYSFSNLSIIIFSTFLGTSLGVTFQHTSRLSDRASCQTFWKYVLEPAKFEPPGGDILFMLFYFGFFSLAGTAVGALALRTAARCVKRIRGASVR